jgi:hypothetical protein
VNLLRYIASANAMLLRKLNLFGEYLTERTATRSLNRTNGFDRIDRTT